MGTVSIIHAAKMGTTVIDGITRSAFSKGLATSLVGGAGSAYNKLGWIPTAQPMATIESIKVNAILGITGAFGTKIGADDLDLWLVDGTQGGVAAATGTKVAISNGAIVPTSISMPWGSAASIGFNVLPCSADGTAPITVQKGQDISAVAVNVDEAYHLKSITLDAVALDYVSEVSIDFGNQASQIGTDGKTWPTAVASIVSTPTISITTEDAAQITDNTATGSDRVVVVTLEKVDTSSGKVVAGSDLTFTTNLGLTTDEGWDQEHGSNVGVTLTHDVLFDGTNAPIIVGGVA